MGKENCELALAFADPCTEVYVCWTHRKIWEIDTTYLSQYDPPKTCEDCLDLIRRAEEEKKKAEDEISKLEPDPYDDWE